MSDTHKAPPTGQGIRIKVSIEETGSGKNYDARTFLSLKQTPIPLIVEFRQSLEGVQKDVIEVFENQFLEDLKKQFNRR